MPQWAHAQDPVNILIIRSYNSQLPWHREFENAFVESIQSDGQPYSLFVENLEGSRLQGKGQEVFAQFIQGRYASVGIDYIIADINLASDFLKNHPELLPHATKIGFNLNAGLSGEANVSLSYEDNFIQINSSNDYYRSVETAASLIDFKHLYVISETQETAVYENLSQFKQAIERLGKKEFEVTYLPPMALDEYKTALKQAPPQSAVYYFLLFQDAAGQRFTPYWALQQLQTASDLPFFSNWSSLLGSGTIGGRSVSATLAAQTTWNTIRSHLIGQQVGATEVDLYRYMFDANALNTWGLSRTQLPSGSIVKFEPPPLWETYRTEVLVGAMIMMGLLIWALSAQRVLKERTRSEQAKGRFLANM
ncbi:MAG: hypothetical protein R3194_10135, partial [Limnobacter sp.]|nr:hypothetical protein [Limnobacter sp.]